MSPIDEMKCPACGHSKHTGRDCLTPAPDGLPGICVCTAGDSRKASKGKTRCFRLLPWATIEELARVYEYGAKKYEANSWRLVENAEQEYEDALMRHLSAYFQGKERDEESGLRHLAHALWNVAALMELTRKP